MNEIMDSLWIINRVIGWLLTSIGYFALFGKDHLHRILAFIPGLREYELAVMSEREEEGRTFFIIVICTTLSMTMTKLFDDKSILNIFWSIVTFAFAVAQIVFGARIYCSLCDVFNRKRRWTILWILFPAVTALIWGLSKKFVPVHKTEISADYEKAAKISKASVEAIQNGITVNLTERSVVEFGKKKYLLRDIHLSIPTGHMVLLLGGSGAGKTTFLNAVTGYEKADAEIILKGHNLYNNYDNMKYDLGFVPQQDLMRLNDTVYMTLSDAARIRLPKSVSAPDRKKRVLEVLEQFGLGSVKNNLVGKLSGGQRKRLSIALELISDPTLFILDEPDSGLDGVVARNLFESLRKIADEGKIVIVITHTPDRVIDLFDDVMVLAKDATRTGRLAYYGPIEESYEFFGKKTMEEILLSINQKDEGGEGRADEFVEKYGEMIS